MTLVTASSIYQAAPYNKIRSTKHLPSFSCFLFLKQWSTCMSKQQWEKYLETPRRNAKPVKIDQILKKRMESFMKAKIRALQDIDM